MTTWNDLRALSKIAITATAWSIPFLIVPPLSLLCSFVAIVTSATSLIRNRREGYSKVDLTSLAFSVLLVTFIVVGTIAYGIANAR